MVQLETDELKNIHVWGSYSYVPKPNKFSIPSHNLMLDEKFRPYSTTIKVKSNLCYFIKIPFK